MLQIVQAILHAGGQRGIEPDIECALAVIVAGRQSDHFGAAASRLELPAGPHDVGRGVALHQQRPLRPSR